MSKIQLLKTLVKEGNGYVDPMRQNALIKKYEEWLFRKKLHILHLIESTKDPNRNIKISLALKGRPHPWQNKINKNPQKIEKTAAKHRGMKRTPETCNNISNAKKEFYRNNEAYSKNMIFIHNIKTLERKYISKTDEIPDGWEIGLGHTIAKGKKWYMNPNDFSQTRNFAINEPIPEGWIPGNGNLRLAKQKNRKS